MVNSHICNICLFYFHKGGIFTFYDHACKEYQHILQQITSLEQTINSLPEGNFICAHNGGNYKWYHKIDDKKKYLSKDNRRLAEQLAAKKYYSLTLSHLVNEKEALERFFKVYSISKADAINHLLETPGYQDLFSTYFSSKSSDLTEWANASFPSNPHHPEKLIHKTATQLLVRSKSEAMIALFLQTNHIPFRYECELQLGNSIFYPDFTIRHPKTKEFYYWEHFGLMDDFEYSQKAYSKLQIYNNHQIIPTINLITTFETQDHPLTIDVIQKTIEHYFL